MRRLGVLLIFTSFVLFLFLGVGSTDGKFDNEREKEMFLDNLVGMTIDEVKEYAKLRGIHLNIEYRYDSLVQKNVVLFQDKEVNAKVFSDDIVSIVVSKGSVPIDVYQEYKVNELGSVPIMMYHGIVDIKNEDTGYIGGNVDKEGYNRTKEAFWNDLEFYYNSGYRMIRLKDFIEGKIEVELGRSPIILTFDDGNENNFRVLGEEDGNLIIDPDCAVGILEEFKKKYPNYGVTATFFVNGGLFGQDKYNEKILRWLVENGYDVGNHTINHVDFTEIDNIKTKQEVSGVYKLLDNIIPGNYVSILALPFGSPYKKEHNNFSAILEGEYEGYSYYTKALLRVGWEAEKSCFDINFDPTFLKRIRAYDNNGKDFDIKMNFDILNKKRYISDGDSNTIVVLAGDRELVNDDKREVIVY